MILSLLGCFVATICFALLLRAPVRSLPSVSLVAMAGYAVYLIMGDNLGSFFVSALVIVMLSEVFARIKKMTSALFVVSGLIPLVPGMKLYRAVVLLAEGNSAQASLEAIKALSGFGSIALAITIATAVFNNFHPTLLRIKKRRKAQQ
jgi:uncharacterized membrane protein YjjB (DUF3815 family)